MSNSQPLISVIVPVYNVEKYICKCIDSLLAQTYPHIEVILVDDGSTDNSGKICDEYAAKDSRIKVVHQPNGGVSAARQTGIDTAIGEYTIHADPDDWVEADMLEKMMAVALRDNADMVICDFWEEKRGKTHYCCQNPGENPTADTVLKDLFQQLHCSCWNKLVKRACYNGIGFYPATLRYAEDLLFNTRVLLRGIKVSYLPQAFYHYCSRSTSIVNTKSDGNILSQVDAVIEIEKALVQSEHKDVELYIYSTKKTVLFMALCTRRLKLLLSIFPEIHERIIREGRTYQWHFPVSGCLSIALRGYPKVAYYLYKSNIWFIDMGHNAKALIHKYFVNQ